MQRAAAGALRTLAFKNEENKNLIVDCQARFCPQIRPRIGRSYAVLHSAPSAGRAQPLATAPLSIFCTIATLIALMPLW